MRKHLKILKMNLFINLVILDCCVSWFNLDERRSNILLIGAVSSYPIHAYCNIFYPCSSLSDDKRWLMFTFRSIKTTFPPSCAFVNVWCNKSYQGSFRSYFHFSHVHKHFRYFPRPHQICLSQNVTLRRLQIFKPKTKFKLVLLHVDK